MLVKKNQSQKDHLISVLSLGTAKISTGLYEIQLDSEEELNCLSLNQRQTQGLGSNSITNVKLLEETLIDVIYATEEKTRCNLKKMIVGLPAAFLKSEIRIIEKKLHSRTVHEGIIRQLLSSDFNIDNSYELLHVIPLEYQIDQIKGITNPLNLVGETIKAKVHLITIPYIVMENLRRLLANCDLEIQEVVAQPYVQGYLIDKNNDIGTTVIDCGGKNTTISAYYKGALVFFKSIPIGGYHITHDLSQVLNCSIEEAERLKIQKGFFSQEVEDLTAAQIAMYLDQYGKSYPQQVYLPIIAARVYEIIEQIKHVLFAKDYSSYWRYRTFVTGGCSNLPGLIEAISQFTKLNAIAIKDDISCQSLAQYGLSHYKQKGNGLMKKKACRGIWQNIKHWFNEDF